MSTQTILITGGTGFLGSALTYQLLQDQCRVAILSRSAEKVFRTFGSQVQAYTRIQELPDAGQFRAVVNLAGAGIFDSRWSEARKQLLRDSRIELTERLVAWIKASSGQPNALISGSAIGFYGDQGDTILREQSQPKSDFAHQLCADWEAAALAAESADVRVCLIRTGLVLGKGGGILRRMLLPFRLGLGGQLGNGRQWMSWVHVDDWVAIVRAMIDNQDMRGAYNATAPIPVSNREFSATLAHLLKRPMLLPLPESMLNLILGEMAALILG
ncbi:MAG: TIGR01777 family oxidoreductase, partial [Methylomonas sp.]|nr:TIGR01777 family oxidoreductase [Methylomonas sp.]